jgi:hypothetical protein
MRAYYANRTPAQRAADQRQAALSQAAWAQQQIVSNQEVMIANQQKALAQQQAFQEEQQRQAKWNAFQQQMSDAQRPQFYQGTVDGNGNVQMFGY